ncbi:DNA replication complex GINS protein PSF3 [Labeo rohita]|uniref:DNA replication complex GINS protein PSF3 n=1 Tax=Labeo rohita TaxID=84645 RepID=A0ABQ8MWC7_LABRO|nr:DNA replication complex GINS protein PSF3 [Labeo rohita]
MSMVQEQPTCGCTCQKCGKFEVVLCLIQPRHPHSRYVGYSSLRPKASQNYLTWLCNSGCKASAKVYGIHLQIDSGQECYGPLRGDRSPPGKGAIDPIPSAKMKEGTLSLRSGSSVQGSPCGLPLPPCAFTKVAGAALAPLREVGIRILNYLDDWLFLAHSSGVVGSASSSEEVPAYDSGQACVGQVRQHCDCGLHQPPGRCTLLSHVTTSPPSHALESTQTQVSTCHSHSGRNQSYSRFPVMTGFARRRVESPHPVGPTDWDRFGQAERSLCLTGIHPLPVVVRSDRGPPRVRCTGTQLIEGLAQVCVSSSEPHHTNFVQSQGGQRTDSLGGPLLAQQNLVLRPGAPGISPSLAHSSEGGPPFSGEGHILAPAPQSLEPPPMVPGRDQEDFRDLSPSVGLDRHLSASTLRVHVAAISANHDLVGGRSVGKHDLIIRFLRGARRLNPPRPHLIPSWDLAVVLQDGSFDCVHFHQRVGDLLALSVNSSCLEFGPADSHVVLSPRPGYVPKVPTAPFRDQVVTLQAISSQEDDPNLTYVMPSPCPAHLHGTNSALQTFGTALSNQLLLRKARLRDTAVTGQSWTLDGHDEVSCTYVNTLLCSEQLCKSAHPIFIGLSQNCQRCLGSQERPLVSYTNSTQRLRSLHQGTRVTIRNRDVSSFVSHFG